MSHKTNRLHVSHPQPAKSSPEPGADASTAATPAAAAAAHDPPLRLLGWGSHVVLPATATTDIVAVVRVVITAASIVPSAAAPAGGDVVVVVVRRGVAAVVLAAAALVGALVEAACCVLRCRGRDVWAGWVCEWMRLRGAAAVARGAACRNVLCGRRIHSTSRPPAAAAEYVHADGGPFSLSVF